jgi:hypothetical protein
MPVTHCLLLIEYSHPLTQPVLIQINALNRIKNSLRVWIGPTYSILQHQNYRRAYTARELSWHLVD